MDPQWILAVACGGLAAAVLLRMMRQRQLRLIGLLKDNVERQTQWSRRRAKAEALAASAGHESD